MPGLASLAPQRLAVQTGPKGFGPGWLGIAGWAGKSWPGTATEFNPLYIYGCLLFLERGVGTSPFYL